MASRPYGYWKNLFIAVDQLINSIFGGSCEETLSAVFYRWHEEDKCSLPYYLTNFIFFWQTDHCYQAYVSEIERKQLGDAYKQPHISSYLCDSCTEETLLVVRCNLHGEMDDWIFKNEKGHTVEYRLLSVEFREKVKNREVLFSANTKLRCRVFDNIWIVKVLEVIDG